MAASRRWTVLVGINYPTPAGQRRAEPGDVVDDLPAPAAGWLAEQGLIEPAPPATRKAARQ